MHSASVQKTAKVLHALVLAALACNLVILYLVPVAVQSDSHSLLGGVRDYLSGILHPGEDDIVMAGIVASFASWFWFWSDIHDLMLTLFLVVSGICTAVILWQARRVLKTILRGAPFSMENAASLRRAAICCFIIVSAALVRVVFSIYFYQSIRPLLTYNALFIPMFAIAGLLCLVMSALFRQAVELQEENDLTI